MALDNRNKKPTEDIPVEELKEELPVQEKLNQEEDLGLDNISEEQDVDNIAGDIETEDSELEDDDLEVKETPRKPIQQEQEKKEDDSEDDSDWKKRYSESSREALIQYTKNKKIEDTIIEASSIKDVSEDDLRKYVRDETNGEFNYDELDNLTKLVFKKSYINERKFSAIESVHRESKELDNWAVKIDEFLDETETQNKYPTLVANAKKFKSFCMRRDLVNSDLLLLAGAYLYNQPKKTVTGSLLETRGNIKDGQPTKKKSLTVDDLAYARTHDHKKYKAMLKARRASSMKVD